MTSLAVLPPLKRSITDIMDEELYHIPNSPIQFNTNLNLNATHLNLMTNQSQPSSQQFYNSMNMNMTNTATNTNPSANYQQQQQQQQQYQQFQHSSASSPLFHHASLFAQNNSSNTSLNIPELILDNLSKHNSNTSTNATSTTTTTSPSNHSTINPSFIDANHYNEYTTDKKDLLVNPFAAYGNPDSFIKSRQMSPPPQPHVQQIHQVPPQMYAPIALPQGFPQRPVGRRTRIVDEKDDDSNNTHNNDNTRERPIRHKKKPTDEFLYNTDISPSHLISINQNDDYLFIINQNDDLMDIEPTTTNFTNDNSNNSIIPGFENDYLLYDDVIYNNQNNIIDEDIEAELSDDEEDDDENDYYHVDDAFDDMMMSMYNDEQMSQQPQQQQQVQKSQINESAVQISQVPVSQEQIQHIPTQQHQQHQQVQSNGDTFSPIEMDNLPSLIPDDEEEEDEEEDEDEDEEEMDDEDMEIEDYKSNTKSKMSSSGKSSHSHNSITAAEISANNPNHQCDLINPSTGVSCNKQFSRPYDLIRHQETIHASKKKIFRCVICEGRLNGGLGNGKDKTFSRGDALSRHIKVKHGLVGKEALDIINEAKENVEYVSV
ncbi:hypothetical protein DFJ63DRAFT_312553 [Scheffersomyces coipomensis]|uniref:uncharacterized protein n=1 Tax=Scheffersomyces coipomensis TaxID=1788519 RepID=UPI00315D5792